MNPNELIQKKIFSLISNNKDKDALNICNELFTDYKKSDFLFKAFGLIFFKKKNFLKSIDFFSHSLDLNKNQSDVLNNLGVCFKENKEFEKSLLYYKKALEINPNYAEAYINLGISQKNLEQYEISIYNFKKALELQPQNFNIYFYIGMVYQISKKYELSINYFLTFIKKMPDNINGLYNLSQSYTYLKKYTDSNYYLKKILLINKNHFETLYSIAANYFKLNDLKNSKDYFLKAYFINPQDINALSNLSKIYILDNDLIEAKSFANKVLNLDPSNAEALNSLGVVKSKENQEEKAKILFEKAASKNPNFIDPLINLGMYFRQKGDYLNAFRYYEKAMSIDTRNPNLLLNYGIALTNVRYYKKANYFYEKCIQIDNKNYEAFYNYSLNLIRSKKFVKGWELYNKRWKAFPDIFKFLKSEKPLWTDGYSKKIFVWFEQGIGDEIMFSSLVNDIVKSFDNIFFGVNQKLLPVFENSFSKHIKFINKNDYKQYSFDYHVPIGNLLKIFRKKETDFYQEPWLRVNGKVKDYIFQQFSSLPKQNLKVGLSWKTSNERESVKRNIDLSIILNKLKNERISFINLQYGDVSNEIYFAKKKLGIDILDLKKISNFNDIDGLLEIIFKCDVIISIDNSTIHLAGSIGKDTRALIPYSSDFRWGLKSNKSYWYKTLKLYRQKNVKDWKDPLDKLYEDIKYLIN